MTKARAMTLIASFCCWLALASFATAHDGESEFIDSFNTTLMLDVTEGLLVTHRVAVHPHGEEIRRGFFFKLPDDLGPLDRFSASVNGEPISTKRDDGALIVAADEDLETHALNNFEISYRARAALRETESNEPMLRWSPIIAQFEFPWRKSSVTVLWPEGRMPASLPSFGEPLPGGWRITYSGSLDLASSSPPVETLGIGWSAGSWPQDVVRRDVSRIEVRTALVMAFLILFGALHSMWRAVGRDGDIGSPAPRPRPPEQISPAAGRFIERMGFDETAFVAALISLRVKGRISLSINADDEELLLERAPDSANFHSASSQLSPGERALERALFANESQVALKPGSAVGSRAMKALSKTLGQEHRGRHFATHNKQRVIGFGLGALTMLGGIVALIIDFSNVLERDLLTVVFAFAAIAAGLILPAIYFELLKAPTRAGLQVRRDIAGLKRYMQGSHPAQIQSREFVELLPWAVALGVEEAWESRFSDEGEQNEDAEIIETVRWYRQLRQEFDSAAAIVPILAASAGATAATSVSAGGASAGGV